MEPLLLHTAMEPQRLLEQRLQLAKRFFVNTIQVQVPTVFRLLNMMMAQRTQFLLQKQQQVYRQKM